MINAACNYSSMTNYHFGLLNFTHTGALSYAPHVIETQRIQDTSYNAHTLSGDSCLRNLRQTL